jgi:LacI family transcriptional regulator
MQDIARVAEVSRTTVSFVLNDKPNTNISEATRQRVLQTAHELGYRHEPARPPQQAIGLIVRRPAEQIAQAAFLLQVMHGLSAAVEPEGYQINLTEVPDSHEFSYTNWLKQYPFAAVAFHNILTRDVDEIQHLVRDGVKLISIGQVSIPGVACVGVDNVRAAYEAVQYLLGLGHRRVAFVNSSSLDLIVAGYRYLGYQQALMAHGIELDASLVRHANFTSESGDEAMRDLLASVDEPPSAVFVSGDVVAAGVMKAARDYGLRIPQDISFASFDDVPFARYLTPPLTTCARSGFDIGKIAGEMLVSALKGEPVEQSILLQTQMVIRESAAPYHRAAPK